MYVTVFCYYTYSSSCRFTYFILILVIPINAITRVYYTSIINNLSTI
nr:MAG TPA: hypothetical protein [Caudoviricetes sp.]